MMIYIVAGGAIAIYCLLVYAVAAFFRYASKDLR